MRSFHVLTFACVLTGVGIVPVRTGGVFVADVFLPVALPRYRAYAPAPGHVVRACLRRL